MMARRPLFPSELIFELLTDGPRITSTECARILQNMFPELDCSAALIRKTIERKSCADPQCPGTGCKLWHLEPIAGHRPPRKEYECEQILGPIAVEHRRDYNWALQKCWERITDGMDHGDSLMSERAETWAHLRMDMGTVLDYHPERGFNLDVALPWEAGHTYRQPIPARAEGQIEVLWERLKETGQPPKMRFTPGEVHWNRWERWLRESNSCSRLGFPRLEGPATAGPFLCPR